MNILVTGATGRLGRALTPALVQAGHPVRATSRTARRGGGVDWVRADLTSGEGVDAAVDGMDAVIHLAAAPYRRGYTRLVEVDGTRRLVESATRARVTHLVYLSIVGVDRVPWGYYRTKVEAEAIVTAGAVPWTVLRVTQFHDLLDEIMTKLARLPVLVTDPGIPAQPVDVRDVARYLVGRLAGPPARAVEEFGGPEVLDPREAARDWLAARGVRRPLLPLAVPGRLGRAFRSGALTTGTPGRGRITWRQYLGG
ncbi:SDR family oxidoreductase [Plantactinospora sp. CA-290183]|uniref:SDR family oxidoreductase n=1 Tax=Plantactinospora sp. CA-290183 TaxID=3240006 RepID=UPI003D90391F